MKRYVCSLISEAILILEALPVFVQDLRCNCPRPLCLTVHTLL